MFDNANISAITEVCTVSTANPNRDGSGTIVDLLIPTQSCLVQSVTVKAVNATANGIVRLFLFTHDTAFLLEEFFIRTAEPSGTFETYTSSLIFPSPGFFLPANCKLMASTENAESFNVFANAYTWSY